VEVFSSPQLRIPHDPPIPSPLICHVDNAWRWSQIAKLFMMQFSPVSCYFFLLRSKCLSSLLSNSHGCSSLNASVQVSHPLYTYISLCLNLTCLQTGSLNTASISHP
jgi:hypothetical protein